MKWLNGIFSKICKSRLKYLIKSDSLLLIILLNFNYFSKKSSGSIDPNNKPWLELKDTTPWPKRRGLIELSNTTDIGFCGVVDAETFVVAEFAGYKNYKQNKNKYCRYFHWMHIFTCVSVFTRTLLPKSTRNWLLFSGSLCLSLIRYNTFVFIVFSLFSFWRSFIPKNGKNRHHFHPARNYLCFQLHFLWTWYQSKSFEIYGKLTRKDWFVFRDVCHHKESMCILKIQLNPS